MDTVAGIIIVRKSGFENLKPIDKTYYHGIYRSMWYDIDEVFFNGELPASYLFEYEKLNKSGEDGTFLNVLKDIANANNFLSLTQQIQHQNEIVFISSEILNKAKGTFEISVSIQWLGYDLAILGGWSLIKHALFENRQLDLLTVKPLNEFGLFTDINNISEFIKAYNKLASANIVDPLIEGLDLECIRIGRFKHTPASIV